VESVLGTPEFMAPELYDENYNEKVDIYAVRNELFDTVLGLAFSCCVLLTCMSVVVCCSPVGYVRAGDDYERVSL
jgi:serine/threonine protein kinase